MNAVRVSRYVKLKILEIPKKFDVVFSEKSLSPYVHVHSIYFLEKKNMFFFFQAV